MNAFEDSPIEKTFRQSYAEWDINKNSSIKNYNPQNIFIESVNGNCRISLSPNGFMLKVSYEQPLFTKSPKFTNSSEFRNRDIKLIHEYRKIIQIFPIFDIPERWAIPFSFLWNNFIKFNRKEIILYPRNIVNFEEINLHEFIGKKLNDYNVVKNFTDITTNLPLVYNGKDSAISDPSWLKLSTWENDNLSPASSMLTYSKNLKLFWTSEATFIRISKENLLAHIHQDDTFLIVESSKFISHVQKNETSEENLLRHFDLDLPPRILRNKLKGKFNY